jgi:hypothetical protein
MTDNPVEHSRTKHIDIWYHFLRDHQQKGDIEIAYVNTQNQLADIFTKPLDEKTFSKLSNELNILDSWDLDRNIAHIAHLYTIDHVSFIWCKCIFLIILVPRLRLMCFQVYFYTKLSIEREMESSAKNKASTPQLYGIIYPLSLFLHTLNWYNPSLLFTCTNGEKILKGSQVLHFWRLMPKGEKVLSPKQKDRTTTISKNFEMKF